MPFGFQHIIKVTIVIASVIFAELWGKQGADVASIVNVSENTRD